MDDTAPAEYTIDELAAHTSVPSRTIRYYQSKGALPKPARRGRKAIYTDQHVERLALIGVLQDRGLQIKAIRDLLKRVDAGEIRIDDWLGLQDQLSARWDDAPRVFTAEELTEKGGARPGLIADLVRLGVLERQRDRYLAHSPALLQVLLELTEAGIALDVAHDTTELARTHLRKLSRDLTRHLVRHAGKGFGGDGSPADLDAALEAARPLTLAVVRTVFAMEMERALGELAASGELPR
jgi:DNA-binding transcriptional MerR regulator